MIIGLTGGIASGKSTVANMLVERGAALVDADAIAREVVLPGSPALLEIAEQFGQAVILDDGSLDRKKLGQVVFRNTEARKQLEAITHPRIRQLMLARMAQLEQNDPKRLVVVDIPLLYESGLQTLFEEVMLVYVPSQVQLQRLMQRDGLDESEARARIDSQMPIDEKKQLADITIDNSGTKQQTEAQVEQFWGSKH